MVCDQHESMAAVVRGLPYVAAFLAVGVGCSHVHLEEWDGLDATREGLCVGEFESLSGVHQSLRVWCDSKVLLQVWTTSTMAMHLATHGPVP